MVLVEEVDANLIPEKWRPLFLKVKSKVIQSSSRRTSTISSRPVNNTRNRLTVFEFIHKDANELVSNLKLDKRSEESFYLAAIERLQIVFSTLFYQSPAVSSSSSSCANNSNVTETASKSFSSIPRDIAALVKASGLPWLDPCSSAVTVVDVCGRWKPGCRFLDFLIPSHWIIERVDGLDHFIQLLDLLLSQSSSSSSSSSLVSRKLIILDNICTLAIASKDDHGKLATCISFIIMILNKTTLLVYFIATSTVIDFIVKSLRLWADFSGNQNCHVFIGNVSSL